MRIIKQRTARRAKKTLTGGNGLDQEIKANPEAEKKGAEIADLFDGLYVADFTLTKVPDQDFDYNLQISFAKDKSGNDVNVENASFKGIHPGGVKDQPTEENPTTDEPVDGGDEVENPSENSSEVITSEGASEQTSETGDEEKKGFLDYFEQYRLFVIIGAVLLLLLLIALVIVIVVITAIVKKKKAKKAAVKSGRKAVKAAGNEGPDADAPEAIGATVAAGGAADYSGPAYEPTVAPITPTGEPGTVFMRIEVYSGHCKSTSDTFSLSNAIVIGSSEQCDIIFDDADVAP